MTQPMSSATWWTPARDVMLLLVLALIVSACTKDLVVDPTFGDACTVGTLRPGRTVTSALNEYSCVDALGSASAADAPYETWEVELEAGAAYFVTMKKTPDAARLGRNNLDPVVALWGRDARGVSALLGVSNDEGEGSSAEYFVVAPRSGRFNVVATAYGLAHDPAYLGGYELSLQRCPVLARVDGRRSETTATLAPSPCRRTGVRDGGAEDDEVPSYNFFAIKVDSGQPITIRVEAEDFTPVWEAFGPGFDAYATLWDDRSYFARKGESPNYGRATRSGWMTLAVGAIARVGPSGEFRVTVSDAEPPPKK